MRIFSESPLDRRDHANRLSCHIIHEFRFSRIDFCSAARCRQRAGESGFYDPPRAFTGISRVHSTATVARTVPSLGASYCTRIFVSRASAFARLHAAANAPESAVGRKRAAPACGRKRLLRPAPRFHGNLPRPLDRHGCAHRALARRITRIFVSRASAFARLRAAASARAKAALFAASPFSGTRVSSYSRSNVWNTRTARTAPRCRWNPSVRRSA